MNALLYGLIVTLFGMTIVFLVLIALWWILSAMKSFSVTKKKQENNQAIVEKSVTPAAANITTAQSSFDDATDDEIVAVIMAAINASMGAKSNLIIRSITRIGDNTPIWGQIGRSVQMLNRI